MSKEIKVYGLFYFVWDDMIILKSYVWDNVIEKANEYFIKYGKDHTYNLYTVNRYDYKDFIKIKSDN
jgi:hypothetical protein